MLIELKGAEFSNLGAAMMCLSTMDRLREVDGSVRFALNPGPHCRYTDIAALAAWQRFRTHRLTGISENMMRFAPIKARNLAHRYGLVFGHEIDAVLDLSGFAYGRPWGPERQKQTTSDIDRLAAAGKPYVFLPQAFGQFSGGGLDQKFAQALKKSRLVFARDKVSLKNILSLVGEPYDHIKLSPDFTLDFPANRESQVAHQPERHEVIIVPSSKLERRSDTRSVANWESALADIDSDLYRAGKSVAVVNHCRDEDRDLCERLAAKTSTRLIDSGDPVAIKNLIGVASMVISGRYHACVSALSQGVPCIGLSWSHKYQELFEDYDLDDFVVDRPDKERIHQLLTRLSSDEEVIVNRLRRSTRVMQEKVDSMWREVASALRR